MTDKREELHRQALVSLISAITGKSHSRVISKMLDQGIVTYGDFLNQHKVIYREMLAEIDG